MEKFGGVGLTNILVIWIVCTLFTLIAKTLVIKYNAPEGVQNVVLGA